MLAFGGATVADPEPDVALREDFMALGYTTAGLGHWWLGSVDAGILLPLLIGSVPGIVLGSLGVRVTPEPLLRIALSLLLAITGLRLLHG
ncbi:MAG: TSUP family transporter [Acetobacteraceae bacterium]